MPTPTDILKKAVLDNFNYLENGERKQSLSLFGRLRQTVGGKKELTTALTSAAKQFSGTLSRATETATIINALMDTAIETYYQKIHFKRGSGQFEKQLKGALATAVTRLSSTKFNIKAAKSQKELLIKQLKTLSLRIDALPMKDIQIGKDPSAFKNFFKKFLITGRCPNCSKLQFNEHALYSYHGINLFSTEGQMFLQAMGENFQAMMAYLKNPYKGNQFGGYTYLTQKENDRLEIQLAQEEALTKWGLPEDMLYETNKFLEFR